MSAFRRLREAGRWRIGRTGEWCILTRRRWHAHIVAEHPELAAHLEWVRMTVEAPDAVYRDADFADRRCLYRRGLNPRRSDWYVKVVVAGGAGGPLDIRTALQTERIKGGETRLWP